MILLANRTLCCEVELANEVEVDVWERHRSTSDFGYSHSLHVLSIFMETKSKLKFLIPFHSEKPMELMKDRQYNSRTDG